jgi:hypothetical protein
MTSLEIQELFAAVGLDHPRVARTPPALLSSEYQLARWRLASLRLQYQVQHSAELAERVCTLVNAQADSSLTAAMWRDMVEWEDLENKFLVLRQRLEAQ